MVPSPLPLPLLFLLFLSIFISYLFFIFVDRNTFLYSAVESYILCMHKGDKFDIRVMFRLCSLWFTNSSDESINKQIKQALDTGSLPTRKFLPLIYQIASRLNSAEGGQTESNTKGKGKSKAKEKEVKPITFQNVIAAVIEVSCFFTPPPSLLLVLITPPSSHFQATALAHPHHVLWQIFALSNGDNVPGSQRGKNRFVVDADKVKAAKGDNILFLFLY